MATFITRLFETEGFPARWSCGVAWKDEPGLGWLHIVSDVAIFGAYMAIPLLLVYYTFRKKLERSCRCFGCSLCLSAPADLGT